MSHGATRSLGSIHGAIFCLEEKLNTSYNKETPHLNVASSTVPCGLRNCRNALGFNRCTWIWINVKQAWGRILTYLIDWTKQFNDLKNGKMMIFLELIVLKMSAPLEIELH